MHVAPVAIGEKPFEKALSKGLPANAATSVY